MNKNKNKNYPSKEFWSLFLICLIIFIYIILKTNNNLEWYYIFIIPMINFFITIGVIILHNIVSLILGEK